jgi:hypothetical protein
MSSDQFFIVLPSNSSMSVYPDNKSSNFKVNLPSLINVDPSKWEVALQEIHFPHYWYNMRKGKNVIIKKYFDLTEDEFKRFYSTPQNDKNSELFSFYLQFDQEISIPPGHYSKPEEILDHLRSFEINDTRPIQYSMDETSKKVSVRISNGCHLDFNNSDVAKTLGFQPDTLIKKGDEEIVSDGIVNISRSYDSVYVYTDIIENQHVGDFKVPLLRVVPVKSNFGEMNWIHYDRPHFLRLSRENINDIEINIRDDTGEFISFESGKVVVTLVFRRIKATFYP